jgi:ArsR family transcriptional regulator, arsenate/arsenite/antimonite-responsive transcriptional repressor
MTDEQVASVARALAHPARVRIVRLLAAQTECRGADVFSGLPLAQSTISEHLRVLREAGLVSSHPSGTGAVYCLAPARLEELAAALTAVTVDVAECAGTKGC